MAVKDKLVTLEDLQTAYNDLKEMIENMGSNVTTGTITLLDTATWTNIEHNSLVRTGNLVQITLYANLKGISGHTASGTVVATIPAGFRPPAKNGVVGQGQYYGSHCIYIDSNGDLSINYGLDSSTARSVFIKAFYIAAEN